MDLNFVFNLEGSHLPADRKPLPIAADCIELQHYLRGAV